MTNSRIGKSYLSPFASLTFRKYILPVDLVVEDIKRYERSKEVSKWLDTDMFNKDKSRIEGVEFVPFERRRG